MARPSETFADIIAAGCASIDERLESCISPEFCESLEQLENRHDDLVNEVGNLAVMVRELALALAGEV